MLKLRKLNLVTQFSFHLSDCQLRICVFLKSKNPQHKMFLSNQNFKIRASSSFQKKLLFLLCSLMIFCWQSNESKANAEIPLQFSDFTFAVDSAIRRISSTLNFMFIYSETTEKNCGKFPSFTKIVFLEKFHQQNFYILYLP